MIVVTHCVHVKCHIMNVFVKGLEKYRVVEAVQHGDSYLANNIVDDFCW